MEVGKRIISLYFPNPCETTSNIIGTYFDKIYTNFKFDPCINFDPEFIELPKGATHPGIRQDVEEHLKRCGEGMR